MYIDEKLLKYDEESVYKLRALYRQFGYCRYKMNKFEEYDLYVKNKDFLISDSVITFTDTSGKLLALKPDVTLSIINNFNYEKAQVEKVYYNENVYRISGRSHTYKEIMQTGLECIGDIGLFDVCEVLLLAFESLKVIDLDYMMQLSHIGFLYAVLDEIGIFDSDRKEIIELISSKNADGIKRFCKEKDLNDFTDKLTIFTENFSDMKTAAAALEKLAISETAVKELREFEEILKITEKRGYKFNVDFSVVGGMRYYSGIVFKGFVNGIPTTVCSGGQYDKLMRKMGKKGSAIGFAVYLDELERFKEKPLQYDIDAVIIDNGDISVVFDLIEKLSKNGESVKVCKKLPSNLIYKKAYQFNGKEFVKIIEND